jgi:Tfp pilus assembly protein PilO
VKPKQFFYVVLGIILAVVIAGGAGYYYAYQYMKAQSTTLSTKMAEQVAAEQQITQLDSLSFKYNRDVEPILGLIDETLPRDKKQSEVLAQVQRLAESNGMHIQSVLLTAPTGLPSSVSQTVLAGAVTAMPISFSVSGKFAQLQTFTTHLENLNRFTNITTLTVKGSASAGTYTYNLVAYIKP